MPGLPRSLALAALYALSFGMFGISGHAQEPAQNPTPTSELRTPIVTLDRDRLFSESLMGKAMTARLEQASAELVAENRRLEAALEAEEKSLTEQRATLPADEFRKLAAEFDSRVEELRTAQENKSRALSRQRDEDRQRLFDAAIPILGALMVDLQAVAIIDRSAIILTFDQLDITALAVAKMDETLGDGSAPLATTPETGNTTEVSPD